MSLDTAIWVGGSAAQAAVVALLLYRRAWRRFPVFCLYNVWTLVASGGFLAIHRYLHGSYLTAYVIGTILDSILEFGVILELAWSVLRPIKTAAPQFRFSWVAIPLVVVAAIIWPFAAVGGYGDFSAEWHLLMHMQQTIFFLRMLVFILLAGCSQLLSIGWRDRELQIATGLGFYAFVGLAVAMLRAHLSEWGLYRLSNQALVASSILALLYWVSCFAQKEPERRKFTPQMQELLLAVAGSAKSARIVLTGSNRSQRGNRH